VVELRPVDYARKLYSYIDIENPPIDLKSILKELNIELKGLNLVFVDAVLIKDETIPIIGYNINKPIERQRFSIAHEIGHFIMPDSRQYYVCNIDSNSPDEKDASSFAEELLMPKPIVVKLWKEYEKNKEYRLDHIAKTLLVSKTALRVRVRRLGLRR